MAGGEAAEGGNRARGFRAETKQARKIEPGGLYLTGAVWGILGYSKIREFREILFKYCNLLLF